MLKLSKSKNRRAASLCNCFGDPVPLQFERMTGDDNFEPTASHLNLSEEMFANAVARIRGQIVDQVCGDHVMNSISQDE